MIDKLLLKLNISIVIGICEVNDKQCGGGNKGVPYQQQGDPQIVRPPQWLDYNLKSQNRAHWKQLIQKLNIGG